MIKAGDEAERNGTDIWKLSPVEETRGMKRRLGCGKKMPA
jgi:hypothetical protein